VTVAATARKAVKKAGTIQEKRRRDFLRNLRRRGHVCAICGRPTRRK